ncbi:MAG: photosynthetic complex putative assembly protein PuhB [Pseudomonadota bacterium]
MSKDDDDFTFEPIRGLPAPLPAGEHIQWQGRPAFRQLAWRAGFIRLLAIWFAVIALYYVMRAATGVVDWSVTVPALIAWTFNAALAAGILAIIALGIQRTTVYTVTNRRVVMRFGMVLDLTINIPFSKIENMDLRPTGSGTGDLSIRMIDNDDLSYFHLWPHARPWRFSKPEAMLRTVPEAEKLGYLLANLVRAEQARLAGRVAVQMPNPFAQAPGSAPAAAPSGGAGTLHPAE